MALALLLARGRAPAPVVIRASILPPEAAELVWTSVSLLDVAERDLSYIAGDTGGNPSLPGFPRMFYDVADKDVVIVAIMSKERTVQWFKGARRKMIKAPLSKVKTKTTGWSTAC